MSEGEAAPAQAGADAALAGESGAPGGEKRPKSSKVRRVHDAALAAEWAQELWSKDESYRVQCTFSASTTHECGIMQEPTHLVELDDLPQAWPRETCGAPGGVSNIHDRPAAQDACANTAHLPCGHVFHACSLALHFLVQDMRCPICRIGRETRMSLACVPVSIRGFYASKLEALDTAEAAVDPMEILDVLTQMSLQVLVQFPRRQSRTTRHSSTDGVHVESLIQSRLLVNEEDIPRHILAITGVSRETARGEAAPEAPAAPPAPSSADAPVPPSGDAPAPPSGDASAPPSGDAPAPPSGDAPAPPSADAPAPPAPPAPPAGDAQGRLVSPSVTGVFRTHRSFQRIIQSILERQHSSSNVLFMLQHPLVPLEITSPGIEVRRAQATLFGQEASPRESIPLFCSSVSGVEPIAYIQSAYDREHDTAEISVAINIAVIANMALYVTEVLNQLSEIIDQN
jgi:hypothetical protein